MNKASHFSCSNQDHQQEIANYICKNEQCIEIGPICTLCAFSTHKDHDVQPVKMILHRMQEDSQNFTQNLTLLAQIDVLRDKLYENCKKIGEKETRSNIKSSIDHYLNNVISKASFKQAQQENGQKLNNLVQKQLVAKIINYQKKYHEQNNEQPKIVSQSNYTRLLKKTIEDLQDVVVNFQECIKKNQIDNSTSQLFALDSFGKKFRFSNKYRHLNIQLVSQTVVKMQDQYVNYNYVILCEPKLSFNKTQSITFHMVNLCSYVTVGICSLNKIAKNYEFNSSQNNHGTYQISYDGYSWSDNNSSLNSQYTSWYYSQGDKVTIEFNPKSKKLKFYKNGNQDLNYELPVEFQRKEKMYFCVTLNSSPQQVHIL